MSNVTTTVIKAFSVVLFVLLLTTAYAAATTTVSIANATVGLGDTVTMPIMLNDITNYGSGTIRIWYNHSVVHVTDATSSPESQVASKYIDNSVGCTTIVALNLSGVSGDIAFANVKFTAVGSGSSPLNLTVVSLYDTASTNIQTNVSNGLITVTDVVDLYPCSIDFSPAWMSNSTDITVTLFNNGTVDACNFTVNVTMTSDCATNWTNITNTSVCANAYKNVTVTSPPLLHCCNYTVNVTLNDDPGTVSESIKYNNSKIRTFHAIPVKLKVTHHYGNWSTYNGTLSGNKSVVMFELYKNVTNYTTPYELLTSETDVLLLPDGFNISGINRSCASSPNMSTWYLNRSTGGEDLECPPGEPVYWYLFVNGVPTRNMPDRMYDYTISCGGVVHIDLLKYVNSGSGTNHFRPRPIMDFPEPFKYGYNGTRWNTIIVYPTGYSTKADVIKTELVNCGVSGVSTKLVSAMTDDNKSDNNMILLGKPTENNIIAEINANHTEVGMPMYFDASNPSAIRLYDDWLYNGDDPNVPDCCSHRNSSYHGVIMACDNPFDNSSVNDSWMDVNKSVWIASGVTTWYANDAADMLASGNLGDKGFWYKTRKCGDIDGNGVVANAWDVDAMRSYLLCTSDWASDVNCDGVVANAWDVDALRNYALNCCACP